MVFITGGPCLSLCFMLSLARAQREYRKPKAEYRTGGIGPLTPRRAIQTVETAAYCFILHGHRAPAAGAPLNRQVTNLIRFVLDECLPPLLRDNKYFMLPLFWLAYRGRNIRETMDFKKRVLDFTPAEYQRFYMELDSISRNRLTDLNT